MRAARAPQRLDGRQALVAEFAQGVEAALEQLARQGEAGAVAAETLGGLVVVGPVGATGPARRLRGLEERPAQRGRALAREVPGGAALVGLVDGDVQPGVADGATRGGEAPCVAEFGEDRHGGQLADAVVAHERPAAWLAAGVEAQLAGDRRRQAVE